MFEGRWTECCVNASYNKHISSNIYSYFVSTSTAFCSRFFRSFSFNACYLCSYSAYLIDSKYTYQ